MIPSPMQYSAQLVNSFGWSEILSIMGFITGLLGLVISFISLFMKRSRLKIEEHTDFRSFFIRTKHGRYLHYDTYAYAVISIIISNCSSSPITISMIAAKGKQTKRTYSHTSDFPTSPIVKKIDEKRKVKYNFAESAKTPIRIEPYDSTVVSIRLPFFNDFICCNPNKADVTLLLLTPRKLHEKKISILEVDYHHRKRYPKSVEYQP